MALSLNGNPLFFDTTTNATANNVHMINAIVWVSNEEVNRDIAIDDDLIITDGNNNKFISKRAEVAGQGLEITFPYPIKPAQSTINVTAIDGGVLYIYV